MIPFDDFKKVDLRAGTIRAAERVEGSEKILKLRVDLGAEIGERQIIAGIGKRYEPETLIGRQIIVVVNLEPRALMGLESQGMLLAADAGDLPAEAGGPVLLVPDREVPPGAPVR